MPPATLLPSPAPGPDAGLEAHPAIDVVVPVYNEQRALAASIRRLHDSPRAAAARSPGGSSSPTTRAPTPPARSRPRWPPTCRASRVLDLTEKGRGRALRAAWSASDADVVCLHGRRPLDRPARAAAARRAAGLGPQRRRDRHAPGARRARRARRQARAHLAHLQPPAARVAAAPASPTRSAASRPCAPTSRAGCSPRCATTAGSSTPSCSSLAQRVGLRIHEVPVDWVDDPDSRVDIVRTALDDLRGVGAPAGGAPPDALPRGRRRLDARLRAALPAAARAARPDGRERAQRWRSRRSATPQANRRFTFRVRGRHGLVRQHALRRGRLRAHRSALRPARCAVLQGLDAAPVAGGRARRARRRRASARR